jgi:hypothetical protein
VRHAKKQPTMIATFEEKTYESYFNNELDSLSDIYFPFGQVQEGSLGFDSSAFSNNRRLWRWFKHPFWFFPPFKGIELREIANEMEDYLNAEISGIPQMKANLLFQYKRPKYVTSSQAKEWSHWNAPYYRYKLYKEQQDLLMHIDNKFGSKILILYASPAIHDVNDLVDLHQNRQIIKNSNFRKVSELNNHGKNTYNRAGTYSIAFSEPERIENFDLIETLHGFGSEFNQLKAVSNREFIIDFKNNVVSSINETRYYAESFRKLNKKYEKIAKYELFYSHLVLSNFRLLTGTQWIIKNSTNAQHAV